MFTNHSQMSYNDTNENSSNNSFASAILIALDVSPSNAITYKRVSKSILKFKCLQMLNKCQDKMIVIRTRLYFNAGRVH
jgi:hypothetical protein